MGNIREEHAVVWNTSLIDLDIDPFTECACGNQLPCPVRAAYEQGLSDARAANPITATPEDN